jgi:acetyltransferase
LRIKFPVVVKLLSKTITHKTDAGGVRLDIRSAKDVREAFADMQKNITAQFGANAFDGVSVQPMVQRRGFELILGSSIDSQFGPVLAFGLGGTFVEIFKDTALGLPPLTTTLARRMMEQTHVWHAMNGEASARGIQVGRENLERLLVSFSQLVIEQPWIKEIDINPLLASSEGLLALDARVVLHDPNLTADQLPKPCIRPYPIHYAGNWSLPTGDKIFIRPIRPEDEPAMVRFHSTLSERSVYYRYHRPMDLSVRTTHERLTRICFIDYDREIALVALRDVPGKTCREIIGVGRLRKVRSDAKEAACAIIVSDAYQHQGLGTELLSRLIDIAKKEGVSIVRMQMLADNKVVISIAQKQGLEILPDDSTDGEMVMAEMEL